MAAYLDILIHRRLWNSRRIGQTYLRYPLFDLAKQIRGKPLDELSGILMSNLDESGFDFASDRPFGLNRRNSNIIRRFLARIATYVDNGRAGSDSYADLLRTGTHGYDIEHIFPDDPSSHRVEYPERQDFREERSWIGGLLLIPSRVNRSFGGLGYLEKREHYVKENMLPASLHEEAYRHNPGFVSFAEATGLGFQPHARFGKTELRLRQELYEQIAVQVWSPDRIAREAGL